ncbi:hypothetical protein ASE95_03840 [Sphingomonas sp. Leaf231]|nr:hypothetical protein ASE95_03840 [Sphingomonas sp. Leaf231]
MAAAARLMSQGAARFAVVGSADVRSVLTTGAGDKPNKCGRSTATRIASRLHPSANHAERARDVIENLLYRMGVSGRCGWDFVI